MDTTIILVGVVIFAFLASRLLQRFFHASRVYSGGEHIAIGVLIGPMVLDVMDQGVLISLQPFVSLLLGILGFRLGLMLHTRLGEARTIPPRLLASLFVFLLCGGAAYGFLYWAVGDLPLKEHIWISATFGVLGAVVSVTCLEEGAHWLRARGWVTSQLTSFALVSEVVAIGIFGLISAGMRPKSVSLEWLRDITTTEWLVASALVGLACGVLFVAFIGKESSPSRIFLATVGVVIFASGMASGLGVSPMFVNLLAGATVAGLSSHAAELERVVQRLEHPSFVVLLILAGAMWTPAPALMWVFIPIYLIVRVASLRVSSSIALTFFEERPPARRFGNGLVGQGVYAVAIAVSFAQLQPAHASFVLTVLLLAVLGQDLVSVPLLRRVLADAEEVGVVSDEEAAVWEHEHHPTEAAEEH